MDKTIIITKTFIAILFPAMILLVLGGCGGEQNTAKKQQTCAQADAAKHQATGQCITQNPKSNDTNADTATQTQTATNTPDNKPDNKPDETTPKKPIKLLVLGDSLSSGYNPVLDTIPEAKRYPALSQDALKQENYQIHVENDSIAGSKTDSGPDRLAVKLTQQRDLTHVLLALGSNDALQCEQHSETQRNIEAMIQKTQEARDQNIKIFLAWPYIPNLTSSPLRALYDDPNLRGLLRRIGIDPSDRECLLNNDYLTAFRKTFQTLATTHSLPLWDLQPSLSQILGNQDKTTDLIHPNEEGHKIMSSDFVTFLKQNL